MELDPVERLTSDIKQAAKTLSDDEARWIKSKILPRLVQEEDCVVWTGARTSAGYGEVHQPLGGVLSTHRYIWTLLKGPPPTRFYVCHHCDNPPCVRIDHLFIGSAQDNTNDKMRKGRNREGHLYGDDHPFRKHPELVRRGEDHGCAKLTEQQVRLIRRLIDTGKTSAEIAIKYNVTRHAINGIKSNRTWRHLS